MHNHLEMTDATNNMNQITETAHQWYAKINDTSVTEAEKTAFQVWLNTDPSHREAYAKAEITWRLIDSNAINQRWDTPLEIEQTAKRSKLIRFKRWISTPMGKGISVACSIIVLMISASTSYIQLDDKKNLQHSAIFSSDIRQIKTIELNDGTRVSLAPNSVIQTFYSDQRRLVNLIKGNGFFEVVNDKDWPFVVNANDVNVTVIGTAFDIEKNLNGAQVSVAEGTVELSVASNNRTALLNANQRITVEMGTLGNIKNISSNEIGIWRSGWLIFDNVTLADVAADLSRYSNRQILVADEVKDVLVSGRFSTQEIDSTLVTLTEVFNIEQVEFGMNSIQLQKKSD
ncbi:MAG: FecR domain-containing protein [Pseudomonadota bacterium]